MTPYDKNIADKPRGNTKTCIVKTDVKVKITNDVAGIQVSS